MPLWTIAGSVLGTLVIVILVLNFRKPEKEPEHRVARHYDIVDPQLRREMGVLLGPAIVPGNRIEALQNGDEIFPAMLEAIRAPSARSPSRLISTGRATSASSLRKP